MDSLSVIRDSSINSLYSVSWGQVSEINQIPELFDRHVTKNLQDEAKRQRHGLSNRNIINLSSRLHQLHESVLDYSNLCFIWKIIGIFSGTLWNYLRLRNTLPQIMRIVDGAARHIKSNNNGGNSPAPSNGINSPAPSNFVPTAPPLNPWYSPSVPSNPVPTPPPQNPWFSPNAWNSPTLIIKPPRPSPSPPPTPAAPKEPPKFLSRTERIANKVTLISKASELVTDVVKNHRGSTSPQNLHKDIQTALKADKYFTETLSKLNQNIDVPLPRWFHATGPCGSRYRDPEFQSVTSIIQNGRLVQSQAPAGYGVYFSTCDESHLYGPWTFAIDEKELEGSEGYFFPAEGHPAPGFMYAALWVRVLKDIPITSETVAFMVANAGKVDELRSKVLVPNNFNVDVMTREEARTIYMYLEIADAKRAKPSNIWEPNTEDTSNRIHYYDLPDNMRHSGWPRLRASLHV